MNLEYFCKADDGGDYIYICVVPTERDGNDLNETESDFVNGLLESYGDEIAPGCWRGDDAAQNRVAVQGMYEGLPNGKAHTRLLEYEGQGCFDDDDDDEDEDEDEDEGAFYDDGTETEFDDEDDEEEDWDDEDEDEEY